MAIVGILGQSGGGISFPATPSAGDTPILVYNGFYSLTTSYAAAPLFGFTANIAGTYRITYCASGYVATSAGLQMKLQKNGVDVVDSEITTSVSGITPSTKTIDVALAEDDVIRVWTRRTGATSYSSLNTLVVSLLAADVQTEMDKYITQVAT